tara:strand:- start:123 stop:734 length:612 start_codon:yes stop_codon:yes gene_type:complete
MKKTRYCYEPFVTALRVEAKRHGPAAERALAKLHLFVLSHAWVEMELWRTGTDLEQAMAWAWEDMVMAFRGYGSSCLTGAVLSYWQTIPEPFWEDVRRGLNRGAGAAIEGTPKAVKRRYLLQHRIQTVRTPEMGFDLPALVPTFGPSLRDWAKRNGFNPDDVEAQFTQLEEAERLGLIKPDVVRVGDEEVRPPPFLRLVEETS